MKHPLALSCHLKNPLLFVFRVPYLHLLVFFICIGFGSTVNAQTVYFEIRNEVRTGLNYDFDVFMYADQMNTYHSRGQIYLFYDTAAFGTSLIANGNVAFQHGTLLSGTIFFPPSTTIPQYSTTLNDNGNRVVATWGSTFGGCDPASVALLYTLVPTTPTQLYHFTFIMKDSTKPANILFDGGLMGGQQFFVNPNPPPNPQPSDCEIPYSDGILPVALAHFDAVPDGVQEVNVKISWSTDLERNSSHFVLERRVGSEGTFKAISMIPTLDQLAGGNYEYIDNTPIGTDLYYQLKSVSMDGHFAYSKIIHLHRTLDDLIPIILYPTPTNGMLTIKSTNPNVQINSLRLYDMSGRRLIQRQISASGEFEFDLSPYSRGVYLLELQAQDGALVRKQVVKK